MNDPTAVSPLPRATDLDAQQAIPQYGVVAILAMWAVAAVPMGLLAWVVAPAVTQPAETAGWARTLVLALTAGLVWQAVLVVGFVGWEQRTLRWPVVRRALWLQRPSRPDGRAGGRLWWVLVPLAVAFAAVELLPGPPVPDERDLALILDGRVGEQVFAGDWTWFVVMVVLTFCNTVVGEELWFRGVMLPRMARTFGRLDWAWNGVLFAAYHLHTPWVMPVALLDGPILALPTKHYRSSVIGIIVHSLQSVVILLAVLAVVVGAA